MSRMIIYLGRLLPAASSDLPEAGGQRHCFCSVLLRMGFTCALPVTRKAVVSYTAFPPLPAGYTRTGGLFLLHFPGSRLHRTLSGILPCEARTFLTCGISALAAAIIYPACCSLFIQTHLPKNVKYFFFYLYMKAASADKLTQNRISANLFARYLQKIVQKFQQALCLHMLRAVCRNGKQHRLRVHF